MPWPMNNPFIDYFITCENQYFSLLINSCIKMIILYATPIIVGIQQRSESTIFKYTSCLVKKLLLFVIKH